jgi:hypothetical protein
MGHAMLRLWARRTAPVNSNCREEQGIWRGKRVC